MQIAYPFIKMDYSTFKFDFKVYIYIEYYIAN